MKLILLTFIAVLLLTACDGTQQDQENQEDQESSIGIGPKGVGIAIGEDLCIDPGTGEVMVCWEL